MSINDIDRKNTDKEREIDFLFMSDHLGGSGYRSRPWDSYERYPLGLYAPPLFMTARVNSFEMYGF